MTNAEALRVVAMFAAYFRQELSDETAVLWAQEMTPFELQDAMEAARVLGLVGGFNFTISSLVDSTRDERDHRLTEERKALPPGAHPAYYPFSQFLAENPDMERRVRALPLRERHEHKGAECVGCSALESVLIAEVGGRGR